MQGIEERVQKTKETQPKIAKANENENIEEDLLESEDGMLAIYKDTKGEKEENNRAGWR